MKFTELPLPGAYEIDPEPIRDERGLFARVFCAEEFGRIGCNKQIVQVNHSLTRQKGSIRGIHYQLSPFAEAKIIRCIHGKAFDVMVDLRPSSPTFLQWHGVELSTDTMRMVYIPEGCGHGFQTRTDDVELIYLHTAFYSPAHERGVRFDDPALGIRWPLPPGTISSKDRNYPLINDTFKGVEP